MDVLGDIHSVNSVRLDGVGRPRYANCELDTVETNRCETVSVVMLRVCGHAYRLIALSDRATQFVREPELQLVSP